MIGIMEMTNERWEETHKKIIIDKSDYNARLRADMVAMLEELREEFENLDPNYDCNTYYAAVRDCSNLTQQKIDALKGEQEAADGKD